jgi:glycerophosphoryl diester phosphodiesterase
MKITILLVLVVIAFACSIPVPRDSNLNQDNVQKYYMEPGSPERLQDMFRYTGDSVPFLSAHRGGPSTNFPENCIETFENTLSHTFSILEIDLIYSKDSVIMLHHDYTLERTTTGQGPFSDYSFKELKEMRLKDINGNITPYQIPTFEEALKWGKGKTIFVVHRKGACIYETIKMIEEFNAEEYAMIMASFRDAELIYRHNPVHL